MMFWPETGFFVGQPPAVTGQAGFWPGGSGAGRGGRQTARGGGKGATEGKAEVQPRGKITNSGRVLQEVCTPGLYLSTGIFTVIIRDSKSDFV